MFGAGYVRRKNYLRIRSLTVAVLLRSRARQQADIRKWCTEVPECYVEVSQSNTLLITRPTGILDLETAERIVKFVEIKVVLAETELRRFRNLTRLDGIHLSRAEVLKVGSSPRRL